MQEGWFYHALQRSRPSPPSSGLVDRRNLTSEQVNQLVHRFIGAAIRVCLVKFRKSGSVNKYGKSVTMHAKNVLHSMRLDNLHDALSDVN
eukprot:scaffold21162_cov65-Attheya_sp.AAC.7